MVSGMMRMLQQNKWENRSAILCDLRDRGVTFKLIDNTLRYKDKAGTLTPLERIGLDVCREGLTEALRREQGLCARCGEREPKSDSDWCWLCVREVGLAHHARIRTSVHDVRCRKQKEMEETPGPPAEGGLFDEEEY